MRCYASGTLEMSKEMENVEHEFNCGYINSNEFTIDYDSYYMDDLEDDMNTLSEMAAEYDITLKGTIEYETSDGMFGGFVFNESSYDYMDLSGDEYATTKMSDEDLIAELESRGYTVTKAR